MDNLEVISKLEKTLNFALNLCHLPYHSLSKLFLYIHVVCDVYTSRTLREVSS